jgi:hypothetical protein
LLATNSGGTATAVVLGAGLTQSGGTLTALAAAVPGAGIVSSNGTVLGTVTVGANLSYSGGTLTGSSEGVTEIVAGAGLSGGTISASGTIALEFPSSGIVLSTGSAFSTLGIGANLTLSAGTLSASGSGAPLTVTDGTDVVTNVTTLTAIGETISGSAGHATLTVNAAHSAPSLVQYAASVEATGTPSVTLGSAPGFGNLLIALFSHYNNNPTIGAGYTLLSSQNGNNGNGYSAAYKFISSNSEPATQSPFISGPNGTSLIVYELSGAGAAPIFTGGENDLTSASNVLAGFVGAYCYCAGFFFQQSGDGTGFTVSGGTTMTSLTGSGVGYLGDYQLTPFFLAPNTPGVVAFTETVPGTPGYSCGALVYVPGV